MTLNAYPGGDIPQIFNLVSLQDLAVTVNNLLRGKVNVAAEFTPAAATTSTVVTDARITPQSIFLIEPTSAAGAAELAGGGMYVDLADRGAGTCTITHTTGAAGELFRLLIVS